MPHRRGLHTSAQHKSYDVAFIEVSAFQLLGNIGSNLISLSLPFYLYATLGYSIWQVCFLFFAWEFAFTCTVFTATPIIRKIGLRHGIAMRGWCSAVFWILLPLALNGNFWMDILYAFPVFLIRGVGNSASEVAYDTFITLHTDKKKSGKVLAFMRILLLVGNILAIVIGGLITHFFGIGSTSAVCAVFFILSGAVLLVTPDEKLGLDNSDHLREHKKHDIPYNLLLSQFGFVASDALLWVLWPIFLIIVLDNVLSISVLVSASTCISILMAYFIGKKLDSSKHTEKILRNSSRFNFVINSMRVVWHEPFFLALIDSAHKINEQSMLISHDHELFAWYKKHPLRHSQLRWTIAENMYTFVLLLATLVFLIPTLESSQWIFVTLFSIGALCSLLIARVSLLQKHS